MEKFSKLLEQKAKSQKPMSGPEKDAKLKAVHKMRKMAADEMASPLKSLKKVTVASDKPEGLAAGLDKAKEMVGGHDDPAMAKLEEETGEDLDNDNEMGEDSAHAEKVLGHDEKEPEDMSPEELKHKIEELQALLKMKM